MGCVSAKTTSEPIASKRKVAPLDINQTNTPSSKEKIPLEPKKHYVPKHKKRVKETVTIKQAKDQEGNKMINNYVLMETLGSGAYGKVKLAMHRSEEKKNQQFAIKILKKSFLKRKREYYRDAAGVMKYKDALDNVKKEIAIMKKILHPNVIRLYEVIENPENDKLYMVLDFANGGQLIEWDQDDEKFFFCNQSQNEPYSEAFLREFFRGCLKGLHYLHLNGIIHRDIKPQNILMDSQGKPKLADFGVSSVINDGDKVQGNEGTYYFMPPEALSKETSKQGYNGKLADIWSLGVTFYCCTFLELPFAGSNLSEIFEVIRDKDLTFPSHRECSQGLKDLFTQMIEKDPLKRANLETLAQNPWLNEGYTENNWLTKEFISIREVIDSVNQDDLENALQISTVVRIKAWVARWKETHNHKPSVEDKLSPKNGIVGEPSTTVKLRNNNNSSNESNE